METPTRGLTDHSCGVVGEAGGADSGVQAIVVGCGELEPVFARRAVEHRHSQSHRTLMCQQRLVVCVLTVGHDVATCRQTITGAQPHWNHTGQETPGGSHARHCSTALR
jgi:hypothetical protein